MYHQKNERKWLLVVDDDDDVRESIIELINLNLGKWVKIVSAKDGLEATNKINCQVFHCIITDIDMPKKEGGAFITSIRHNAFNELTPVVVVSGNPNKDKLIKEHPFIHFLEKPFNCNELTDIIRNQIQIGSNERRVSADVFNNLIDATESFLNNIDKNANCKPGMPTMKKSGIDVEADLVSTIQINIGKVSNTFSILARTSDILHLVKSKSSKDLNKIEYLQKSMGFIILKHVMKRSGIIKSSTFTINRIDTNKANLKCKSGIVIPIGNDDFRLKIFATAK